MNDKLMILDFGSGYNPKQGFKTCDITSNPMLDYHFDVETYRINCEDSVFDYIRCKNVLHHVEDLNRLYKEFQRVLKPNGQLYIYEPNKNGFEANVYLDKLWYNSINRIEIYIAEQYRDYEKLALQRDFTLIFKQEKDYFEKKVFKLNRVNS
jgi:ubiquinone/menaquinone biosynthesis C-methylase UbiE